MIEKRGTRDVHFNARLPRRVADLLRRYAERRGLSASAAAAQLLDEGLRGDLFPGIDFRWSPSGRHAFVTGTGLAAWELHMIWNDHGRSVRRVLANYPSLKASQVQAAAAYIEAFPEEIPDLTPPAWVRRVTV